MKKIILILLGLMLIAAITCEAQDDHEWGNREITNNSCCKQVLDKITLLDKRISQLEATINALPIYEIDTVYSEFNTRTQSVFVGDSLQSTSNYVFSIFPYEDVKFNVIISEELIYVSKAKYNVYFDTECEWWNKYLTDGERNRLLNLKQWYDNIPDDIDEYMRELAMESYIRSMIDVVMRGYIKAKGIKEIY